MSKKNSYTLITGVAGFIGMSLALKFLKNNIKILGIDSENNYYDSNLKKARIVNIKSKYKANFIYFKGDITNLKTWEKISSYEIKNVIHLAAQPGVRYSLTNPWAYIESNIIGFQRVIDFVISKKINQLFYASSSSVYGKSSKIPFVESQCCNDPESYYAATKITNELMASAFQKTHNLISVGLRFFTVYGPWGRPDMAPFLFVNSAFEDKKIKVFNFGNQKRDFTYIDDITESIYKLFIKKDLIKKSTIFNIGNGNPIQLLDFISLIEKLTNKNIEKEFVKAQKGDVEATYSDTEKLSKFIGFKPKTKLENGIKKFIDWYQAYYYSKK